jgi:hypothetical protein
VGAPVITRVLRRPWRKPHGIGSLTITSVVRAVSTEWLTANTAYRDAFNLANRVNSDESSLELQREGAVSDKVSKGDYT